MGDQRAIDLELRNLVAKVENIDRSVQELALALESDQKLRTAEIEWIKELVEERKTDLATAKELEQKNKDVKREMLKSVGKAVWEKGGQWLVFGLVAIILIGLNQALGLGIPFLKLLGK